MWLPWIVCRIVAAIHVLDEYLNDCGVNLQDRQRAEQGSRADAASMDGLTTHQAGAYDAADMPATDAAVYSQDDWAARDAQLQRAAQERGAVPAVAVADGSGALPTWGTGAAAGMQRAGARIHGSRVATAATSLQLLPGGTAIPACLPTQGAQVCILLMLRNSVCCISLSKFAAIWW